MTEYSFYQVLDPTPAAADATLPKLLEKVVSSGKTAVVLCRSEERLERLDELLWSYQPSSFLPHAKAGGVNDEDQPVILTTQENFDSTYQKTVLVRLSGAGDADEFEDITDQFERVLDLFEASDIQKNKARARWKKLKNKGVGLTYFQNDGNGWHKKA